VERTLDISRIFAGNEDILSGIRSTLSAIREDIGAFGVLVSSVEKDIFRLVASSGYDNSLSGFSIPCKGIVASQSIEFRRPIWVEDVSTNPAARPVHPKVRCELLIPLFQAGEEEGVLEIAFDSVKPEEPFLIETLTPVAAYLGGLIHGRRCAARLRERTATSPRSSSSSRASITTRRPPYSRIGEYCVCWRGPSAGRHGAGGHRPLRAAPRHRQAQGADRIPLEAGPLTADEFDVIVNHPSWGPKSSATRRGSRWPGISA
jgi:hypothetical protein